MASTAFKIYEEIYHRGGHALIVGGYVRDALLGIPNKDQDVEVYGLSVDQLTEILSKFSDVDCVGKSFGILKVDLRKFGEDEMDFSLPRRESKSGQGHKGFIVNPDPFMSIEEASARRDFTINSMALDPMTGEILDPHNGIEDLRHGILRATSEHFTEDPLRVLRGMQFASRFNMSIADETVFLCRSMVDEFDTLAKERILGEFNKMFLKGKNIEKGLDILYYTNWITKFPELFAMIGCQQDVRWHPEGDVWDHTKLVCEKGMEIAEKDGLNDQDKLVLMYSCLLHDCGKPQTTEIEDDRITSQNHAKVGVSIARSFLNSINADNYLIENVLPLVENHMVTAHTYKAVNKLAVRLQPSNIEMLYRLIVADASGRDGGDTAIPSEAETMLEISRNMKVSYKPVEPILLGRHLIDLGMKPSKEFGIILHHAYDAQLDGEFATLTGAIRWFYNFQNERKSE